jgi:hypothetical protein
MRHIMSNGRLPKRSIQPQATQATQVTQPATSSTPIAAEQARKLILRHQAQPGMRILGHLDLGGAADLYYLPDSLTCESLDISDCINLTTLPIGLHVTRWIELAGSGITQLPAGHGFVLRWRGVQVDDKIAFAQSLSGQDTLETENVELRRILIERLGYETFLQQVGGLIRDRDQDRGGERQLIAVPFEDDEPLIILKVICPSTGHLHLLRVPPQMRSCRQAAAWIAGFERIEDYDPLVEA